MVDRSRALSFVVTKDEAGGRIDHLLIARLDGWGRRAAARLFASGAVTVDGKRARKGDLVREGQQVVALLVGDSHTSPAKLQPCLVTRDVVVVDKPAGMPSARLPTSGAADAASALLARFPEMEGVGYGPREPGLVHRLDTFTSGLLLAARSQFAFEKLRLALTQGGLVKRYLAVVPAGTLPGEGTIGEPLAPHPKNKRKVVTHPTGRPSSTTFRVVERRERLALIEVTVGPAYRHQVRVHLASIGHPLVGDELYGGTSSPHLMQGRHALHASYLACDEPDLVPFEARAPLPKDMRRLLDGAD